MGVSSVHVTAYVPHLTRRGETAMRTSHLDARHQYSYPTLDIKVTDVMRKERLSYAIREGMRRKGLSAPELANLIGRAPVTVGRWVRGETTPSILDVAPLAEALGVRADFLIDPPAIPEYPIEKYLLEAVQEGVQEGLRRARPRRKET